VFLAVALVALWGIGAGGSGERQKIYIDNSGTVISGVGQQAKYDYE